MFEDELMKNVQEMDDAKRIQELQDIGSKLFKKRAGRGTVGNNEDKNNMEAFISMKNEIEVENIKDEIKIGIVGDLNGDGIHDEDRDGDGLPNTIDDGLDALHELLEE